MTYDMQCTECKEEARIICRMSEKDAQTCECGGKMKVIFKKVPTCYGDCGGGYGTDRNRG